MADRRFRVLVGPLGGRQGVVEGRWEGVLGCLGAGSAALPEPGTRVVGGRVGLWVAPGVGPAGQAARRERCSSVLISRL